MKIKKILCGALLVTLLGGCSFPSFGVNTNGVPTGANSALLEEELANKTKMSATDLHMVGVPLTNVKVEGRVIAKSEDAFIVYDGTDKIMFMGNGNLDVEINDTVVLYGDSSVQESASTVNAYFHYESAKYAKKDLSVNEFKEATTRWYKDDVESYSGKIGPYVSLSVNVYKDGDNYYAEKLSSLSTRTIKLQNPLKSILGNLDFSSPLRVIVTGFPLGIEDNTYVNVMVDSIKINENEEDTNRESIIDIYATNDVHGRVSLDTSSNEPGIARIATYLEQKKEANKEGFIHINSGDYWQDTYESGYNKGKLLTECLDLMECETMSLGNHEFDWGVDVIRENKELVSYTKFLGANIRQYPNTEDDVDFAEPYKIIERDGVRIGVIGAIGKDQITSITSSNWEDITFLDHVSVVKEVSDELRTEQDCDVVILSIHADESVAGGRELTAVSSVSNKKYVDAVFCAHSHQSETTTYNGVPFIQAGDHGKNLSHVKLKYFNGEVTILSYGYEGFGLMTKVEPDAEVQTIIDKYFTKEYLEAKDKVHGTIEGANTISSTIAGNLLAKATYDLLQKKNIDCDIVINNGARGSVNGGEMTSEKIFNMIPFTNKTLVVENIKGEDIIAECVEYPNPYYMPNANLEIREDGYYTVACIDYMMLHKSARRYYNYFPSYNASNLVYTVEDYPNIIIENYLQENKTINTSSYTTYNYNCLG